MKPSFNGRTPACHAENEGPIPSGSANYEKENTMKFVESGIVEDGICASTHSATFDLNDDERKRVTDAFKVIKLLKLKALVALKTKERDSDFTSYRFSRRKNTVTVYITQGMVG